MGPETLAAVRRRRAELAAGSPGPEPDPDPELEDWWDEVLAPARAALLPAHPEEQAPASVRRSGRRVLMVGDGLNDAPALAAADVSLSPITAADLTRAQADAVFLGERLQPVCDTLLVARRARALMRQNLGLALVYNLFAVPLAFLGFVTPLVAALAMSGSSTLVTLNALRAQLPARAKPFAEGAARAVPILQEA